MAIKIEEIKQAIEPFGWKLISENYKNLDSDLQFQCDQGHIVMATWKSLRNKLECPICRKSTYQVTTKVSKKKKDEYRILALDQASHTTGYSIFSGKNLIYYGTFQSSGKDDIERDAHIKEWLISMIELWEPDLVGLEGIQFQQGQMGVTVFETLARLQGILMETCYELKIAYKVVPTNTWRNSCGVRGRTRTDRKRSMQLLIEQWFDKKVTDDEADAIGIGKYLSDSMTPKVEMVEWE